MERLSALDAAFLAIEDRHSPMSIGSAAICSGPPPTDAEIQNLFEAALAHVPRYRQKLQSVPFGLARPVWVDDPSFRLDHHLGRLALPEPGGRAELAELVGRLMSQPLDRERPLWESWVVEGLQDGQWALVSKLHHCLADGVSGSELLTAVLLAAAGLTSEATPPEHKREPVPGVARLLVSALADQVREARRDLVSVEGLIQAPRRLLSGLATTLRGASTFKDLLRPLPASSLAGPISTHRKWEWTTVGLAELKEIQHRAGVTLNDVALTIVSGALRRYQTAHGEPPSSHPVRSLVPVSVREAHGDGTLDNQVSALVPELPVNIADPLTRLRVVHERLAALKASGEATAGRLITRLADSAPWLAEEWFLRATVYFAPPLLTTVTTNVPGPPVPLTVLGRPLLELVPYVPLGYRVRVGVAMMSYADRFCFAVTSDEDRVPDVHLLVEAVQEETAALAAAIGDDALDRVVSG